MCRKCQENDIKCKPCNPFNQYCKVLLRRVALSKVQTDTNTVDYNQINDFVKSVKRSHAMMESTRNLIRNGNETKKAYVKKSKSIKRPKLRHRSKTTKKHKGKKNAYLSVTSFTHFFLKYFDGFFL